MNTFKQLDNSQDLATQLEIIGKSVRYGCAIYRNKSIVFRLAFIY